MNVYFKFKFLISSNEYFNHNNQFVYYLYNSGAVKKPCLATDMVLQVVNDELLSKGLLKGDTR